MATAVIMPRQGQSVESCLIGKWYKKKGDKVSAGDLLFTYETDKAVFEEESRVDGILLDIFFEEGDDVECLVNVCVIGTEGESVEDFRPAKQEIGVRQGVRQGASVAVLQQSGNSQNEQMRWTGNSDEYSEDTGLPCISPRAKRLAEKTMADLRYAVPTGADGRIIERDVQAVLSSGFRSAEGSDVSAAGLYTATHQNVVQPDPAKQYGDKAEIVTLSKVRKLIANTMLTSLLTSAQLTSHTSFDATDIFTYRSRLKEAPGADGKTGITVTDIIIFAASRVLLKHKSMNAHFHGDKIALFKDTHIGVAVDTPRGLLVPTVFDANKLTLPELSVYTGELFEKCKSGSVPPDQLKGASFTVSNLGGLGIEMFTPIINPPQTGILGVCSMIERFKNGKPYPALGLSLTYDHQALDGADSARFLKDLVDFLENFSNNL